jgi:hypothetical protein
MIRRRAAAFGRAHRAIDRTSRIAASVRWAVAEVWTAVRIERGRDARSTGAAVRHVGVHGALDLWRLTAVHRGRQTPVAMAREGRAVQCGDEDGERTSVRSATGVAPWIHGVEVVNAAGVVLLLPHETGLPIRDGPVAVVDELRRCARGSARPAEFARARERVRRVRAGVARRAVGFACARICLRPAREDEERHECRTQ